MPDQKYTPYYKIQLDKQEKKLMQLQKELPEFTRCFFEELERLQGKAFSTLINYAMDLKIFFTWARDYVSEYSDTDVKDLPVEILSKLHVSDIKNYMLHYIPKYTSEITVYDDKTDDLLVKTYKRKNSRTSAARKLATLKKFYHFYNNFEPSDPYYIENDPVSSIKQAKDKKENIKYLDDDQTESLFNCIATGEGLSGNSKAWSQRTKERDIAIISLFLGTGLRVSELVGINLQDISWDKSSISVFRKEQRKDTVFFSDDVKAALLSYINNSRISTYQPDDESKNALFLSLKHGRMTVSAVERCVNKYTRAVMGSTGYTPHKLRDTFATRVYAETHGNAKKLQTALNHKSASTSLDFYVAATEAKEKEQTFKETHISGLSNALEKN